VRESGASATRLLFVVNEAGFFLSHRLVLAEAARSSGYDVHVATPPGDGVERITDRGFPHHPLRLSRRGSRPWSEAASLAGLVGLYQRLQPQLVHHVTVKPVLYGSMAARITGVRAIVNAVSGLGYVFIASGELARMRRRAVLAAYRVAFRGRGTRVIFQNEDDRGLFVQAGLVPRERTVLIRGSGVDLAAFRPRPEPPGPPVVVLPARMLFDKGVGEFVDAAAALRAQGVVARFVLVGDTDDGNPAAIPADRLRHWQEEGSVEWWGHRTDMAGVLSGAHVVCLPSYREGLPKALLEASAAARPIVTTDVPGCRDVVRNGENGWLVPVRDSASLTERLRELILDAGMRARFGRRGREIAEAEFGVERVVAATLALYRSLATVSPVATLQPFKETP
jgi:glycosyltransferase involved in cell wall biosynthesis